jgi:hypothetical protein
MPGSRGPQQRWCGRLSLLEISISRGGPAAEVGGEHVDASYPSCETVRIPLSPPSFEERFLFATAQPDPDVTPPACEICKNPLELLKVSLQTPRNSQIAAAVRQAFED